MEKDYGVQCSQLITFVLIRMLLTWAKMVSVCVSALLLTLISWQCHLMAFLCVETGVGWIPQPRQCDLSLKHPPPQQSPLLPEAWRVPVAAAGVSIAQCLVPSLTQLLNETPDESVLTNPTWVYGCHLPGDQGEVLSVSWGCCEPKRWCLYAATASFFMKFYNLVPVGRGNWKWNWHIQETYVSLTPPGSTFA